MSKIAPSILSADFSKLGDEIKEVEQAGADYIHVDVMDGHFVPNITIGPLVVEAIRPISTLPLDVHLMIENPDHYIDQFADSGADIITVHYEACTHLHRTIMHIKEKGVKAGLVINPATPVELIRPILPELDLLLFMTVNPGFGGQSFIPSVLDQIKQADQWRKDMQLDLEFEVDGGINTETARWCKEAGIDVFVAGSFIFNKTDRKEAIDQLRQVIEEK
ncbi:ribulose-phosphate 3-epimerase [Halolactibacillus miurensis]|uniref:Ribulose-phosphate 3-epimerase n=1 Tax=Halolactibacillus miurensis TaxID=306541 RepID=A0A1I6QC00_9BACI|nr:ribulose-phosphate 3-epimerase [Halolactibacillus miurensis]GEM03476.1 ribulose-phosphate 3-epimerase [Halolactibacillus miurensis]SFS50001.1 ribulose-phosphate 3-epimerase [Halolactibacillus miurensis]